MVPYSTGPYGGFPGSPVWASAYIVIARMLYRHYGDSVLPVLKQHYPGFKSFMAYLLRHADPETKLVLFGGLGDWVPPGGNGNNKTPTDSVTAFYWLLDLSFMVDIATVLGETADAQGYRQQLETARLDYHAHFWNEKNQTYSIGSQSSLMMPLVIGATPSALRQRVVSELTADIKRNSYGTNHLVLGIVGTTFIFDLLSEVGEADVGIDVLMQDAYPSYGHMIANGATTLWEAWEGTATEVRSSRNHIMFGGNVGTWVFSTLAGLDTVSNGTSSGWQHILIKPAGAAIRRLGSASASQDTRFGMAAVSWKYNAPSLFLLNVTIPPGSTSEIFIPLLTQGAGAASVEVWEQGEGGKRAWVWKEGKFVAGGVTGITGARVGAAPGPNANATLVLSASSGSYSLTAAFEL